MLQLLPNPVSVLFALINFFLSLIPWELRVVLLAICIYKCFPLFIDEFIRKTMELYLSGHAHPCTVSLGSLTVDMIRGKIVFKDCKIHVPSVYASPFIFSKWKYKTIASFESMSLTCHPIRFILGYIGSFGDLICLIRTEIEGLELVIEKNRSLKKADTSSNSKNQTVSNATTNEKRSTEVKTASTKFDEAYAGREDVEFSCQLFGIKKDVMLELLDGTSFTTTPPEHLKHHYEVYSSHSSINRNCESDSGDKTIHPGNHSVSSDSTLKSNIFESNERVTTTLDMFEHSSTPSHHSRCAPNQCPSSMTGKYRDDSASDLNEAGTDADEKYIVEPLPRGQEHSYTHTGLGSSSASFYKTTSKTYKKIKNKAFDVFWNALTPTLTTLDGIYKSTKTNINANLLKQLGSFHKRVRGLPKLRKDDGRLQCEVFTVTSIKLTIHNVLPRWLSHLENRKLFVDHITLYNIGFYNKHQNRQGGNGGDGPTRDSTLHSINSEHIIMTSTMSQCPVDSDKNSYSDGSGVESSVESASSDISVLDEGKLSEPRTKSQVNMRKQSEVTLERKFTATVPVPCNAGTTNVPSHIRTLQPIGTLVFEVPRKYSVQDPVGTGLAQYHSKTAVGSDSDSIPIDKSSDESTSIASPPMNTAPLLWHAVSSRKALRYIKREKKWQHRRKQRNGYSIRHQGSNHRKTQHTHSATKPLFQPEGQSQCSSVPLTTHEQYPYFHILTHAEPPWCQMGLPIPILIYELERVLLYEVVRNNTGSLLYAALNSVWMGLNRKPQSSNRDVDSELNS